ncbi:hypothetical protein [Methylobacterium sp. GC_Met_2]|uniref:hypothetical protein n=1 Tax=Methylobacterium sp. GC_Met_2 TaxID=2937376 RepID=UPI00226B15A8|nr:hypothetical protein [Methylobacterium sp. GC_Met_2]
MDQSLLSPANLQALLEFGAAAVATAGIEELTKDAYGAVRAKIREIFGRPGERALIALEADPASATARQQVTSVLATIEADDREDLRPVLEALIAAINRDAAAQAAIERYQVRLDLDVGKTANIEDLEGLESLDIRAKTGDDFNLKRLLMSNKGEPGK